MGAKLFYADSWTDMTELIVTFSPPKKKNINQEGKDRSSGNRKVGADLHLVDYWSIAVLATVFTTA